MHGVAFTVNCFTFMEGPLYRPQEDTCYIVFYFWTFNLHLLFQFYILSDFLFAIMSTVEFASHAVKQHPINDVDDVNII